MATVVFVCLHGSAKSLIAASYFTRFARERGVPNEAASMGLDPDAEVPPGVIDGLGRDGFEVAGYSPQPLNVDLLENADLVVTFGCELPPTASVTKSERWDDLPMVSDGFEPARDAIVKRVRGLVESMQNAPGNERTALDRNAPSTRPVT